MSTPYQSAFFAQFDDLIQFLDALQLLPRAMFMIKDLDSRYVFMSEPMRRAIHRGSDSGDTFQSNETPLAEKAYNQAWFCWHNQFINTFRIPIHPPKKACRCRCTTGRV